MNNFVFFTSGYLLGYLTSEYKYTLLYNGYKYYVIANEYYDDIKKYYNKSQNYYSRGSAIKISDEIALEYDVPLHNATKMFRACEYTVEGKPSFTIEGKMPEPHQNGIDDPILSANLYYELNNDKIEKDITYELNSFLINDRRFLYSHNMKKVYDKLLQGEGTDLEKGKMWVEYMDGFSLTMKKLTHGHLVYEDELKQIDISN